MKGKKINRKEVYNKYDGHCAYCGEKITPKQMQVDHIIPQSRFHQFVRKVKYHVDDIQNLNPACRICNYWKHNFTVEQFRREISKQPERLIRDNGKVRFALRYKVVEITNNPIVFYFEKLSKKIKHSINNNIDKL